MKNPRRVPSQSLFRTYAFATSDNLTSLSGRGEEISVLRAQPRKAEITDVVALPLTTEREGSGSHIKILQLITNQNNTSSPPHFSPMFSSLYLFSPGLTPLYKPYFCYAMTAIIKGFQVTGIVAKMVM